MRSTGAPFLLHFPAGVSQLATCLAGVSQLALGIRHRPTEPRIVGSSPTGVIYLSLLCFLLSSISNINDICISWESKRGQIDGNGVFCHWTTDATDCENSFWPLSDSCLMMRFASPYPAIVNQDRLAEWSKAVAEGAIP